jgi:transcription elongation factor GreA
MNNPIFLTADGYNKKSQEIQAVRHRLYREIPNLLKKVSSHCSDPSKNEEYHALLNERDVLNDKLRRLEDELENATIINGCNGHKIGLGSRVVLCDLKRGEKLEIILVSPQEVDPELNQVSMVSPCGRVLLGKKAGAIVTVGAPRGNVTYKILRVNNS